jgi:hypothetical protein
MGVFQICIHADLYYIVSVLLCLLEQNAYFNVLQVVFNKREVVFYQSTKGRGRSPRPFVL